MINTVGVAMIARNGGPYMRLALEPFVNVVNDIAIVLGGQSDDNTEAIAYEFTQNVRKYNGPLDDQGRLLDFGAARQQSFDMLKTPWAIVVDTDDQWHEVDRLYDLLELADKRGAVAVLVPYKVDSLEMHQLRIYRRDAGRWEMPIHEYFRLHDETRQGIKTDWLYLRQSDRTQEVNRGRLEQNVSIAEHWLKENGDNRHVLAHLAKDLGSLDRYEEAVYVAERYLRLREKTGETGKKHELASVLYHKAGTELLMGHLDAALPSALSALAVHNEDSDSAPVWALLSEILYVMSGGRRPLCELSVFSADQALRMGRARNGFARDNTMSLAGALSVKASALEKLGRLEEARGALDLGLMICPEDGHMVQQLRRVSRELDELP